MLTIADQVVCSGSSFLTGVIIGRTLSVGDFGSFSLGMTLLIFSLILQDTLLATPYTYHFHKTKENEHPRLRAGAIIQSFLLSALCAGLLIAASFAASVTAHAQDLGAILNALGLSLPLLFLRECFRRQFFTEFKMKEALVLDICINTLQFLLLFFLWYFDALTPASVFGIMAAATALGSAVTWIFIKKLYDFTNLDVATDTRENIRYGRWLLAGSFCHLGSLYTYPWLIYLIHGKTEAGAFAACYSLINLLNPLVLGFNNYFRPKIIQTRIERGALAMDQLVRRACVAFIPVTAIVILFLSIAGGFLVNLVYGEQFPDLGPVIAIVGISLASTFIGSPLQLGVLALNKPQINPMFHASALAITLCVGVPLVFLYGNIGAAIGYALASNCGLITLAILYKREVRKGTS